MCYLLTSRFAEVQDLVLRLIKSFVERVGKQINDTQMTQFLLIVSQIKLSKDTYEVWKDCLGAFMTTMGPKRFFTELPLRLTEFDLYSLTYAQDSRSYLIQIFK